MALNKTALSQYNRLIAATVKHLTVMLSVEVPMMDSLFMCQVSLCPVLAALPRHEGSFPSLGQRRKILDDLLRRPLLHPQHRLGPPWRGQERGHLQPVFLPLDKFFGYQVFRKKQMFLRNNSKAFKVLRAISYRL
jgi:hypothetical protein